MSTSCPDPRATIRWPSAWASLDPLRSLEVPGQRVKLRLPPRDQNKVDPPGGQRPGSRSADAIARPGHKGPRSQIFHALSPVWLTLSTLNLGSRLTPSTPSDTLRT